MAEMTLALTSTFAKASADKHPLPHGEVTPAATF
jgi:hypothetical protein